MMDDVAERLIMRRDTHIDSLLERLKEPRVRQVIEPVITGDPEKVLHPREPAAPSVLDVTARHKAG